MLGGDFARYVIGTNSHTTNWLSLRLDEDPWRSIEEQKEALRLKLSDSERLAWEEYKKANTKLTTLEMARSFEFVLEEDRQAQDQNTPFVIPSEEDEPSEKDPETKQAEQAFENTQRTLRSKLTPDHLLEFDEILQVENEDSRRYAPRFDLSLIQRYVLWRVFDLGWTTERFGAFDRSVAERSYGREASKPERIGKKYQWIAYHEILAYIADHYQYREQFHEDEGGQAYEGPWQEYLRDIDPSCCLLFTPGGRYEQSHSLSWWAPVHYENWDEDVRHWDWIEQEDDLPDVCDLLSVEHPRDGTRWLNVYGYFNWQQLHPADVEPYYVERREIWFICQGYLIQAQDTDAFMDWAKGVDFWNHWMPEPPEIYRMFLGEHGWSPAFRYFKQLYYGCSDWITPERNCPTSVRPATFNYNVEAQGFDCSVDESYILRLPDHDIVERLGLKWTRQGANFIDKEGRLATFDPTAHEDGPSALLIREDLLRQYLSNEGLALCWTIIGEKWVLGGDPLLEYHGALRISGAYQYTDQGPEGFLNFLPDKPRSKRANK